MKFKKTGKQREAITLLTLPGITNILLSGGSRSGKTTILCYSIIVRALKHRSRHAILRLHFKEVKNSIGRDTMPKLLDLLNIPYTLDKTDWYFTFENGSEIWLGGLDEKERVDKILGMEYSTIYFNESSQLSYHGVTTALTRLAEKTGLKNKAYYDCNPPYKSHWLYKLFKLKIDPENKTVLKSPEKYGSLDMNPMDNAENLPEGYIEDILGNLPARKRARFLLGEWLDELEGSLWKRETIDNTRVVESPILIRVVVGVDPAVTSGNTSNDTGIIVVGLAADGHLYVLGDYTLKATPLEWARAVIRALTIHRGDKIVGEVNNGGDLVEVNIRTVDKYAPFDKVHASRGKLTRAEPVSSLYEQGLVHHVGSFVLLEDEMCEWAPESGMKSPDRMDALVWAITELVGGSFLMTGTARKGKRAL
jgi:hypothetical protein